METGLSFGLCLQCLSPVHVLEAELRGEGQGKLSWG